jgi:hypothetical protein
MAGNCVTGEYRYQPALKVPILIFCKLSCIVSNASRLLFANNVVNPQPSQGTISNVEPQNDYFGSDTALIHISVP